MTHQFRNPARRPDGCIICEINHEALGWIPYLASPDDSDPVGAQLYAEIVSATPDLADEVIPPLPRKKQRRNAFREIDELHARFLVEQSDDATEAERSTWPLKEAAARAVQSSSATTQQAAMIAAEATGAGMTEAELVTHIIAKTDHWFEVVGQAAQFRAKARRAVKRATRQSKPLEVARTEIEAAMTQLDQDMQAAITQLATAQS